MTQSFSTHAPLVVTVLFFLSTVNFSAAQPGSPPSFGTLPTPPKFNPSLAVLVLIIVGAFFCLGFFSLYVRRCTDRGGNFGRTALPIGGGGRFSRRRQQGLDPAVIQTFPLFLYSTVKGHKIGKGSLECAVCLNEFEDDQTLRLIPKCSHVFHPECIDAWLGSHNTCPVCRANLLPEPGDPVSIFVLENNPIEPGQQPNNNDDDARNNLLIRISDENDQNPAATQVQSPDLIPNRPPRSRSTGWRSWSTGWRLDSIFPKSGLNGHLLVQPGENTERFTLRLPKEIRNRLLNTHLNRAKSCVAFPRATSSRRGYRSKSGGSWHSKNYFYHEQFDHEVRPDGLDCSMTPFSLRTGSVRLLKGVGDSDEVNVTPPKSVLKSIKSPFDRLFIGTDDRKEVDERSSDWLRPDDVRNSEV